MPERHRGAEPGGVGASSAPVLAAGDEIVAAHLRAPQQPGALAGSWRARRSCRLGLPAHGPEQGRIPDGRAGREDRLPRRRWWPWRRCRTCWARACPVKVDRRRAPTTRGAFVVVDCAQSLLHYGLDVQDLGRGLRGVLGPQGARAGRAGGPVGQGRTCRKARAVLCGAVRRRDGREGQRGGGRTTTKAPPAAVRGGHAERLGRLRVHGGAGLSWMQPGAGVASGSTRTRSWRDSLEGRGAASRRLRIYGNPRTWRRTGAPSSRSTTWGRAPLLIGRFLDSRGINIRVGTHCAEPLDGVSWAPASTCRISLAPYNTTRRGGRACGGARGSPSDDRAIGAEEGESSCRRGIPAAFECNDVPFATDGRRFMAWLLTEQGRGRCGQRA